MTGADRPADALATVAVRVSSRPAAAFDLFTREVDSWWRRGPKFRHATGDTARIGIEPEVGGRVFETWRSGDEELSFELGRVTVWQRPERLAFTWRNAPFAPLERTEVEVTFVAMGSGTLVTVCHRGWQSLRQDHPARHGMPDQELARSVGLWWGDQLTALREQADER